jgi:hypothetical protein
MRLDKARRLVPFVTAGTNEFDELDAVLGRSKTQQLDPPDIDELAITLELDIAVTELGGRLERLMRIRLAPGLLEPRAEVGWRVQPLV